MTFTWAMKIPYSNSRSSILKLVVFFNNVFTVDLEFVRWYCYLVRSFNLVNFVCLSDLYSTVIFRFSTTTELQCESSPANDVLSFIKSTLDESEGCTFSFFFGPPFLLYQYPYLPS